MLVKEVVHHSPVLCLASSGKEGTDHWPSNTPRPQEGDTSLPPGISSLLHPAGPLYISRACRLSKCTLLASDDAWPLAGKCKCPSCRAVGIYVLRGTFQKAFPRRLPQYELVRRFRYSNTAISYRDRIPRAAVTPPEQLQ